MARANEGVRVTATAAGITDGYGVRVRSPSAHIYAVHVRTAARNRNGVRVRARRVNADAVRVRALG